MGCETPKIQFLIERHGESTDNAEGIQSGWHNSELTELGMQQAVAVGTMLQGNNFHKVIHSSDLTRAEQTATIIAATSGIEDPEIVLDPALRERNYGIWQGQPKKQFKELKNALADDERPNPQGESLNEVRERSFKYINKIARQRLEDPEDDGQTVTLIATSRGVATALLKQQAPEHAKTFPNCGSILAESDGQNIRVIALIFPNIELTS